MTATEEMKCWICGDFLPASVASTLMDGEMRNICMDCACGIQAGLRVLSKLEVTGQVVRLTETRKGMNP